MHPSAEEFCRQNGHLHNGRALDIGGAGTNGNARYHWPNMKWTVLDLVYTPQPGVAEYITADARSWEPHPGPPFGLVLCTETLQHIQRNWPAVISTAYKALRTEGLLIITTACDPRTPHNMTDGTNLPRDEYYENILPYELDTVLKVHEFRVERTEIHIDRGDLYTRAVKF